MKNRCLKSEEPGIFSHVCDVRIDRLARVLVELHGTPHTLIFLIISTGAVLRLLRIESGHPPKGKGHKEKIT